MPDIEISSREFASGTSHQYGEQLTHVRTLAKITYTLDQVTERGAVFRMSILSRYGTQSPEVGWIVVRSSSDWPSPIYSTRKSARKAIGA